MSYKLGVAGLKIVVYSTNCQLVEITKSIWIFVLCFYIDVRNIFDKNNELLF